MTPPNSLGRYQIEAELGRGGMATVYRAVDPQFNRQVAIKVLPRHFLHDPTFRERFQREAQTIATLEHRAIVPVYDFGYEDDQPFLVMRFMSGGTLGERLGDGPLPFDRAQTIVTELAGALTVAHERGVIHRDLKPDNILFDEFENPYLSDFGIVKLAAQTQTFTQGIIGTPAYMSPEQWRGRGDLDGRCDQYALTVILYQLLTGDLPFTAAETTGYMLAHVNEPVPDITHKLPTSPPGINRFFQTAMAKQPAERFADMNGWVDGLSAVAAGTFTPTPARIAVSQAPETIVEPVVPPLDPPALPPGPSRSWLWAGGGGILLVGLLFYFLGWPSLGGTTPAAQTATPTGQAAAAVVDPTATSEPSPQPTAEPTAAVTAAPTSTPAPTFTPTSTPTPEPTPFAPPTILAIEWVEIPAGSFTMGIDDPMIDEASLIEDPRPAHEVELPTYWISKFEITNEQYKAFIDATDHRVPTSERDDYMGVSDEDFAELFEPGLAEFAWDQTGRTFPAGRGDHPATEVSWEDAQAFASWLSEETGLNVRLPSEAEWEKAARGDLDGRSFPWGDEGIDPGQVHNFCDASCGLPWAVEEDDGFATTSPVGSYPAGFSPYGVADMSGNVWEWTRTVAGTDYPFDPVADDEPPADPRGWIIRGASWRNSRTFHQVWFRASDLPTIRVNIVGFRVVTYPPAD